MSGFSNHHISSYEKRISIYQLQRMCRDGRLVFPPVPSKVRARKIESVSETLETILMGILLSVVYVSERQDGSLLVVDGSDRLLYFMEFLEGEYPVAGLEFYSELNGCRLEELERKFPRITSLVYDYKMIFQVIEYTTPKYMHMQAGNYIGKWNFVREQGIRNELYGEKLRDSLYFLERNLGQSGIFFSRWKLNRQYFILRILMYRFVFEKDIQVGYRDDMGLQQLMDQTAECLARNNLREVFRDFVDATERLIKWKNKEQRVLIMEKEEEQRAKTLGYLYNVVWICRKKECKIGKGLKRIFFDEPFWEQIKREKVTYTNIRKHYYEIEKRLR